MRKLFALIVLVGFAAYFIWPTRFQEYAAGKGPFAEQVGNRASRVDRITGDVWVMGTSGKWERRGVRRPELLRPDITGPQPNTRVDTGPAQQQLQTQSDMNSQADQMMESAVEGARNRP